MKETISVADAGRRFSKLLRAVGRGQIFVITRRGRPIVRISPISGHAPVKKDGLSILIRRLQTEQEVEIRRWKRDDLYQY
jgi:prevent-host-death family protein